MIALSDSDDVWHTWKLEVLEQLLSSAPDVGLVFTDGEIVDASLKSLDCKLSDRIGFDARKQRMVRDGKAFDLLLAQTIVVGATMAFRSELRDVVLPLPTSGPLYHDGWIALILAAVTAFEFVGKPAIKYREHPAQSEGLRASTRLHDIAATQKTSETFYLDQAEQFQEAYVRLETTQRKLIDDLALSKLQDKISHLQARASMPPQRLSRLGCVLKELANLRYHRFSRGWYSAGKDLLIPRAS